jgi:hypothetical protein
MTRAPSAEDLPDPEADMLAYYEARAPEYDDWYLRRGRYARGPIHDAAWNAELDAAGRWLDGLPIHGEIVELAAGTGWWSPLLASKGEPCHDAAGAPLGQPAGSSGGACVRMPARCGRAGRQVDAVFTGFWLAVPAGSSIRRSFDDGQRHRYLRLHRFTLDPQSSAPTIRARRRRPCDASTTGQEFSIVRVYERGLGRVAADGRGVSVTGRAVLHHPSARASRTDGNQPRPVGPTLVPILRAMSSLTESTIATVGSGVMAEAMIAGILRGGLVQAEQIVASHQRAERREHLERTYGIRTVASNVDAVDGADVILFGIKPQMLARVGREIGPHLRRGQLVLSVLAGATSAALTGMLGHYQVVRSMPNTPPGSARA